MKERIKTTGGNIDEKEVNKIMLSGSQMGLDPKKGEKTKNRTKVLDKIKGKDPRSKKSSETPDMPFGKAKKGEDGR